MNVNELKQDYSVNINPAFSKKVIFDMNSERAKKRMAQMQKRKEYLNETDSLKYEKSTFSSTATPHQVEESTPTQFSNMNNIQNNELNYFNQNEQIILNPFSIDENEKSENDNSDVEVNVSDLDCNIEIDNNNNNEIENLKAFTDISSKEYAKNFCHSSSKSFVHLNNNLVARAAAQNEKNTPSYLLALCPEILRKNVNNKDIISENYAVDDAINEENEIETPNKSKNINYSSENIKSNNDNFDNNFIIHKEIKSETQGNINNNINSNNHSNINSNNHSNINSNNHSNNQSNHNSNSNLQISKKGFHKKSKSGISYNNILRTNSIEYKKNPLLSRMGNNSNNKNVKNSCHVHKNSLFDNKMSIKFPKNKPAIKINSTRELEHKKKNLSKNIPIPLPKKPINNNNFSKTVKNSIPTFPNKSNSLLSHHNKSKTVYTTPSFITMNSLLSFNTLRNNSSSSRINNEKKSNSNKPKNKINEIKKEIKFVNCIHRKTKTCGSTLPININNNNNNSHYNKNYNNNNNANNILSKNKLNSNIEYSNKNKIISALQKLNYGSNQRDNFSKALLALNNSKCSLFTILVFCDNNISQKKKFIFRGLYEINSKDSYFTADKIFSPSFCQSKINIKDVSQFFNYDVKKDFIKFKFQNNDIKKFNCNTILIC